MSRGISQWLNLHMVKCHQFVTYLQHSTQHNTWHKLVHCTSTMEKDNSSNKELHSSFPSSHFFVFVLFSFREERRKERIFRQCNFLVSLQYVSECASFTNFSTIFYTSCNLNFENVRFTCKCHFETKRQSRTFVCVHNPSSVGLNFDNKFMRVSIHAKNLSDTVASRLLSLDIYACFPLCLSLSFSKIWNNFLVQFANWNRYSRCRAASHQVKYAK